MKRFSRLAIVGFVAGCMGWAFASARVGWLLLLAMLLALVAIVAGSATVWSTRAKDSQLRGRGLAVAAVWLGIITAVRSLAVVVGLVLQLISSEPGRRPAWQQNRSAQDEPVVNPMPEEPAAEFTSNLPVVVLDTGGRSVTKRRLTAAHAQVFDVNNGRSSVRAKPVYDGLATICLRGYSTLHLPKHSYTLHTVDNETNQVKTALLGLPAEADWVLYAPYEDKSLMRDVLAYELANRMGRYAPRTRFVELFVRTSDRSLSMRDYVGVYVLAEKIKRGKERVNIAKLEPEQQSEPEISGGYIIKRDHNDRSDTSFRTRRGGPYSYVYPKADRIAPEQKRWIRQYLNSLESALYGPGFADRDSGYAAYLDVDSFIDAHWLIEMSKNVDGFRYSAFLTKDRGGKLKLEPPWDWNRAFGNANYYDGWQTKGWYWPRLRPNEISWYHRLQDDPEFRRRCAARWIELRKDVFDPQRINRRIDELASELSEAQQRNFQRWPVLGRQVTCNYYVGHSFQDEVRWLKKWIERRIAWIDGQVGK